MNVPRTGSYYLPRHFWPSPLIFLSITIFLSRFVPPFWVSLSCFVPESFVCLKSLSRQNLNQIDLLISTLIIFILRNASSIGWVVVAVAVASVLLVVQKGLHRHHLIRVLCLFGSDPKFTRCQWYCLLRAFPKFPLPPWLTAAYLDEKFDGDGCCWVHRDWHCW